MGASLKQLKVISRGEEGSWKRIPVSGGHRDKRVGESVGSIFIEFHSEGLLEGEMESVARECLGAPE